MNERLRSVNRFLFLFTCITTLSTIAGETALKPDAVA